MSTIINQNELFPKFIKVHQMPLQPSHLPFLYDHARNAYLGHMTNAEASRAIAAHADIPVSSAGDMVRNLKHILRGERYRRRLSSTVTEYYLQAIHEDFGRDALGNALASLWAHIVYYEGISGTNSVTDRAIHGRFERALGGSDGGTGELLPAALLAKATPEYIWLAVQGLVRGDFGTKPFSDSTSFDLIAEEGMRLSPVAVFGIALGIALETAIEPGQFVEGEGSLCFQALRAAGYEVIPKGQLPAGAEDDEREWDEGRRVLRSHMARERAPSLSKAKRAQYRRMHGVLKCEECGLVPSQHYETALADACIEVHHASVTVSEMGADHKTRLEDLQCLCANCHRLIHRRMREARGSNSCVS